MVLTLSIFCNKWFTGKTMIMDKRTLPHCVIDNNKDYHAISQIPKFTSEHENTHTYAHVYTIVSTSQNPQRPRPVTREQIKYARNGAFGVLRRADNEFLTIDRYMSLLGAHFDEFLCAE